MLFPQNYIFKLFLIWGQVEKYFEVLLLHGMCKRVARFRESSKVARANLSCILIRKAKKNHA